MGLLSTLADILSRPPVAKPEYGPMSDALAKQSASHGATGGLLNAIDPYILDPRNSPEHRYARGEIPFNADVAERFGGGLMGTFGGINAKTADLVALKKAEGLAAKGVDNEAVRQATGWFKGMDGKWRFEIDDSMAHMKGMKNADIHQRVAADLPSFLDPTIGDMMRHNSLYDAYPGLKKLPIEMVEGIGGAYGDGGIALGRMTEGKSTPLHEAQHYIQSIEGFANGGSSGVGEWTTGLRPELLKVARESFDSWKPATYENFWGKDVTAEGKAAYNKYLADFNSPEGQASRWLASQQGASARTYQRLAGEIESRDVSARMNLTPAQRLVTPPDLRSDAIVRYGNGPQMSVPPSLEDMLAPPNRDVLNWVKNRDRFVSDSASKSELYHGTSGAGFESLDPYRSNYGLFGNGGYLTESPRMASEYTKKGSGKSPGVIPGYANIKNPIDMDAPMSAKWKESPLVKEYGADLSAAKTNEDAYRALEQALIDNDIPKFDGAEIIQDSLKDMGHDGITHIGGGRVKSDGERHRVWITFEPEQFKSRFNRGTFDEKDPNMLRSLIPAAAATAYGIDEVLPYD